MPRAPTHKITIFISSPTDVMMERERAARVIDRLQSRFREYVTIAPVFFEDRETYYTADKSFQEQIPDAGGTDLVVSIFWSRLGSELSPDLFGTMPDGKPYPGGAVYELMRALAAKRQRDLPDILVYRKIADTGISVTDPQQRRMMTAQLDAFEAFWKQWFVSEEGHFRAGFQTFNQPEEFGDLLERHLRSWLSEKGLLGREVIWRIAERGSPFRGLQPYGPEHADVFFGRDREIDRGRERLLAVAARRTAFLLVMGSSGAGKSSLARAGLVTRLSQPGDIAGVRVVRFAVLRPGAAATPQRALAEALFRPEALPELLQGDSSTPALLATTLEADASVGVLPILAALGRSETNADEARLIILVDQLEELFATAVTDIARHNFVRLLVALAREGHIFVIATLRSSDYGVLARETELLALKDAGATLDLTVPGPEVLADIVRRPTMAAGLLFDRHEDKSLDEELLAAAGGNADALPLLGFTLQWLFEHREGERLTFEAYKQLGGLDGAIGRAAEETFQRLDRKTQAALPQLLRGLAGASHGDARLALRDMPLASAPEGTPLRKLADALVDARILLLRDENHGTMLRLAHDAVLRGWERARDITTKEQDFFRIHDALIQAEQRWREQRRNDLLLAPGLPLAEAQSLAKTYRAELAPQLLAFIDASAHKEQRRQRRGYALAAIFGLVALIAIVAGLVAWREQRLATAQALRADQNFTSAKSTLDKVILDLARGLQDLDRTPTEWEESLINAKEARSMSNRANIMRTLGPVGVTSDDVAAAYRDGLQAARKLALQDPGDRRRERDIAVILNKLGDALKAPRDRADALAVYRESLQISQALATKDPSNTQWQRDVSVSLNKIGDVLEVQGDHVGALVNYRESLNIRRALATKDRSNTQRQHEVSVSLNKVGDVLETQGDHVGGLANYRESLQISQALAAKDPSNEQWQRDVEVCLKKVADALNAHGDMLAVQGDHAGALANYRESLNIRRMLAMKDASNTERQSELAWSLDGVGEQLGAQADHAGALANYRESLNIRRALVTEDADKWQWDVAWSLYEVGGQLAAQGNRSDALAAYRESLNIARPRSAKDQRDTAWQAITAWILDQVGVQLEAQGDLVGALANYRESLQITQALATKDPSNTQWQRDLRVSVERVGNMAYRFVLARDFAKALETADQAISLAPGMIWLYTNRAHALMFLGRVDEARAIYVQYQGKQNIVGKKSWEAVIVGDFVELRKAGLKHPLMDEIEKQFSRPR